jgi:hypothetical protein
MKLTSTQIERTIGQFEAQAIPEDHPVVPQLNDLFGEHTFFLDRWTQYLGAGRGQSGRGAVGQGRTGAAPLRVPWNLTSLKQPTLSSCLDSDTDVAPSAPRRRRGT